MTRRASAPARRTAKRKKKTTKPISPEARETARRLEGTLGHTFRNSELLLQAVTHPSFAYEGQPDLAPPPDARQHYEAMEFLGDAVLGFLVAEQIYLKDPARSEGEMSRQRAALVNARTLGEKGHALGLGKGMRLGRGERASGGEMKRSILADAFEAVLGAVFLDGGITAARRFVQRHLGDDIRKGRTFPPMSGDHKTRLQEIVQSRGGPPPAYRLVSEAGPPHDRVFEVAVELPDGRTFRATGGSKKQAEQSAAGGALAALAIAPFDPGPEHS